MGLFQHCRLIVKMYTVSRANTALIAIICSTDAGAEDARRRRRRSGSVSLDRHCPTFCRTSHGRSPTAGVLLRRRRKAQAEEVTGEMTDELKAELHSVPSSASVDQLKEYIETKQAEADSIVCGNTRVVEEHKCVPGPNHYQLNHHRHSQENTLHLHLQIQSFGPLQP